MKKDQGRSWAAPEHGRSARASRRFTDYRTCIRTVSMEEPACLRSQREADRRKRMLEEGIDIFAPSPLTPPPEAA